MRQLAVRGARRAQAPWILRALTDRRTRRRTETYKTYGRTDVRALLAFLLLLLAACDNAGQDRVLGIDARGDVAGTLFLDRNTSRALDTGDSLLANVRVKLVVAGTRDTATSVTTDAAGVFRAPGVAVGRYQVVVDAGLLGDSLEIVRVSPDSVVVQANDTLGLELGVGYPRLGSLADLATATLGRRLVASGIAVNGSATFGDSTLFLSEASGALMVVGVRSAVAAGDSVRVLGTVGQRFGSRVLTNPTVFPVAPTTVPAALDLTSAQAAAASGGTAESRLARVLNARVIDTATVGDSLRLTLDDGSGQLVAMVKPATGIDRGPMVPAAVLDVTGVIVLTAGGTWRVQPRGQSDITVRIAVMTVAQVRAAAPGTRAAVTAVTLSAWSNFGDSTLFIHDGVGSLRAVRVASAAVAVADSVRLTGTVASREAQPVLQDVTVETFGTGTARVASDVTTAAAAQTGALDAALVKVTGAAITDTVTQGGDLVLTTNDGSGALQVVVDADVTINRAPLVPGAVLNVTGVLAPTGTGQWRLRPRSQTDVAVVVPVVTVATARAMPIGDSVVIVGIALNDRAAFGDQTVHFRDGTGSLRATGVTTLVVFAGDSARFRGTLATVAGQRVLQGVTVTRLVNLGAPTTTALTTAAAASANAGVLDAALVRVTSAAITARAVSGADLLLTVTDGSAALEVVLDADAGIDGTPFQAGAVIDASGVLVPTGTGQWRLKPRSTGDLVVRVPVVTVAQARARPAGDTVVIRGTALNVPNVFGDSALHVADTTVAQQDRSIRVLVIGNPTVFTGDSIRVRGVVGSRDGQPVLTAAQPTVVGIAAAPVPRDVTSQVAANAFGGRFDAAFTRVVNATITDTQTVGSDFVMTVDDGSGPLDVVLDGDITFNTAGYTVTTVVTVRGLLVPSGVIGRWVLKPRVQADIVP